MSLDQVLAKLDQISSRLAALESKVGGGGGGGAAGAPAPSAATGGDGSGEAPAVAAFQELVDQHLGRFAELSAKIGGDVAALAPLLLECVAQSKLLIGEASRAKKPADIQPVIKPLSEAIAAVSTFQSKSRDAKQKNNVYGVGEGIGIFSWVVVEPAPAPFAAEMVGSAKFYTNKILQEFKGKDETQVAWTHAWVGFAESLVPYIKKFHTTGLTWNPRGEAAKAPVASAAPAAAKSAPAAAAAPKAAAPVAVDLSKELNKGGDITSGLKKITRDQTNKDKKISGAVVAKEEKVTAAKAAKPSRTELVGSKWMVEWHHNAKEPIVIKATARNQSVLIYKCENSVVIVEGKINSIAIDGCKKVGVVFDDCLATCEVVGCSGLKLQVKEKVPAIAVDKTAGIQIFLPKTSLDTEIVTATSSEMNVVLPNPSGKEEDDPVELPIPEQFKTVYRNKKLVTDKVDHSGG